MSKQKQLPSHKLTLDQVLQSLKKKDAFVRATALESLVRMDHSVAVSELIKALSDRSPLVRQAAAECLGVRREKNAIDPLVRKLSDRSREVRMRVAESLGILLAGQKSPPALIQRLRDPAELVRIQVAEALGSIGDQSALSALWGAMHDRSPLVRSYVAAAIGALGTKKDISKLEATLRQERSDTSRVGFYHALYTLGQNKVLADLLKLLESGDYRVRCAAANTLREIADRSSAVVITRALRRTLREEPTFAVRSSIQKSLQRIGEIR